MFRNSDLDRIRETFADQFANDPNGIVYRKGQKGAPFRISERERDEFISTFDRRIRFAWWSIIPATVAMILLMVWLIPDSHSVAADIAVWAGIGAILLPFMSVFRWAWNAPSHELQRRAPEGVAFSKAEARAFAFSKIAYSQLAIAAIIGAGLIWRKSEETDVFHGWGMVWLICGGALIGLSGIQAIRKFRFNRSHSGDQA
ncbi:hypothetical protein [Novosphingobium sp.]|uniref:hypothetical protein n=1 Tax=Novosphingobium sp. TaxID=1874826 RepID=UPI0025EF138B|nr:hypothetical protein [Novosphingobium sp.]